MFPSSRAILLGAIVSVSLDRIQAHLGTAIPCDETEFIVFANGMLGFFGGDFTRGCILPPSVLVRRWLANNVRRWEESGSGDKLEIAGEEVTRRSEYCHRDGLHAGGGGGGCLSNTPSTTRRGQPAQCTVLFNVSYHL